MTEDPNDIDVLFPEVDGLRVQRQSLVRKTREVKIGVVHESWKKIKLSFFK